MLTYIPSYSLLGEGTKVRLMRTWSEPQPSPQQPASKSAAILTADPGTAQQILDALTHVLATRGWVVDHDARSRPGEICYVRRAALAALAETGTPAGTEELEKLVAPVRAATTRLPAAVRRAAVEEVGRLLDGTEDVIVPVSLLNEFGGLHYTVPGNGWLADPETTDQDVLDVLDEEGDGSVLFEGLLSWLRSHDDDIDELADHHWVDPVVPDATLRAWVARNRPHLVSELADLD